MQARPQSVEAKFEPKRSSTQGAINSLLAHLEWNETEKAWIADIEPPVVTEAIRKMGIDQADGDIFCRLTRASIFQHSTMHAWPNSYASKPASFLEQYANIKSDPANPLEKKIHISHKEFGEAVNAIARSAERKLTYIYYVLRDNKIFLPMAGQEALCSKSNSFLFKKRVEYKTLITLKIADDRASYEISHKNYGEITIDNFAQFKKEAWEKLGFYFTDDSKKIVPDLAPRKEKIIAMAKQAAKRKASIENTNNTPAAASSSNRHFTTSQQPTLAAAASSNAFATTKNSDDSHPTVEQSAPKRQKTKHHVPDITTTRQAPSESKRDEAQPSADLAQPTAQSIQVMEETPSYSLSDMMPPVIPYKPMDLEPLAWERPLTPPPYPLMDTTQDLMLYPSQGITTNDVAITHNAAAISNLTAFSLFNPANQMAAPQQQALPQNTTVNPFHPFFFDI